MTQYVIVKKDFGVNLKLIREHAEVSQGMLAEQLNKLCDTAYSSNNVSKWESGAAFPPISLLPGLSKILEVPMVAFFNFNSEIKKNETAEPETLADTIDALKRAHQSNARESFEQMCQLLDTMFLELKSTKRKYESLKDKAGLISGMLQKHTEEHD